MTLDPVDTNPAHYSTVFENDRVRVLEYRDAPGESTTPHDHPDSVMCTLSSFTRRLASGEHTFDVQLPAGTAVWLPAQRHSGHNTGDTETHVMLIELKGGGADPEASGMLGPDVAGAGSSSGTPADADASFGSGHA